MMEKWMRKWMLAGIVACFASEAFAAPVPFSRKPGEDGSFTIAPGQSLISTETFKVSKDLIVTFSCEYRYTPGDTKSKDILILSYIVYGADGKPIFAYQSYRLDKTETELAAPANAGDTTLKIKDGSKWRKGQGYYAAFNVQPDKSDLPNRDVHASPITSVSLNEDGTWSATLANPLTKSYKVGTTVGVNRYSTNPFAVALTLAGTDGKWKHLEASLSGYAVGREPYITKKWWKGVESARGVVRFLGSQSSGAKLEVRNVDLTIKLVTDIF